SCWRPAQTANDFTCCDARQEKNITLPLREDADSIRGEGHQRLSVLLAGQRPERIFRGRGRNSDPGPTPIQKRCSCAVGGECYHEGVVAPADLPADFLSAGNIPAVHGVV